MTIGVIDECRKFGIGSMLLDQVYKTLATSFQDCSIVYLHVVDYNMAAIKFYKEKHKFQFLKKEEDYYEIFEKPYAAELYYKILDLDKYLPCHVVEF